MDGRGSHMKPTRLVPTWAAVTVLLLSSVARCPSASAYEAEGDLRMWSDCAVFRMTPGVANGYAEFYFELKRADLEFRRLDDVIRADVFTWVHVTDSTGSPVDSVGS